MPPETEERFGLCSEAERVPHEFEKRAVGADDRYGEVTVLRCARCGRCWLHYFVEYEYLSASGRWLEGEISPEIAASHEFERLRLSIRFACRYRIVLLGLYTGHLLMPQLSGLSQIVSQLAFRMESAMQELGERASVAAELASTLN